MARVEDDTNSAEVINVSSETMKFEVDGIRFKLAPRERITIHKNYTLPRVMQEGRDPVPSAIELMTNGKVLPVSDKRVRSMIGAAK